MLLQVQDLGNDVDVLKMKDVFDSLSQDPYVAEKYRYKHLVRVVCDRGNLSETEHGPFFQSLDLNPTHGNVSRTYPKLDVTDEIKHLVLLFAEMSNIPDGKEILVQAQRIKTSPEVKGHPAVEGFHRDGIDELGLFCAARENITGGLNQFKRTKDSPIYAEMLLEPGRIVLIDDTRSYHYATPIVSIDSSKAAYRDVILLCAPAANLSPPK